ncbi:hypothetical protein OOG41_16895 [Bacillus sp. AS_5]|nr:hypothetical protein [Bacillus sp. AS_5]HDR7451582.1 hypothetical protein [Bacillus cereus]
MIVFLGGDILALVVYYNEFKFINTKFSNVLIQILENTTGEFRIINNYKSVNNGSVLNMPVSKFEKSTGGSSVGRLCVLSSFSDNSA